MSEPTSTPTSPRARALADTLTAEVEVLSLGTVVLDGECWTYTLRPA